MIKSRLFTERNMAVSVLFLIQFLFYVFRLGDWAGFGFLAFIGTMYFTKNKFNIDFKEFSQYSFYTIIFIYTILFIPLNKVKQLFFVCISAIIVIDIVYSWSRYSSINNKADYSSLFLSLGGFMFVFLVFTFIKEIISIGSIDVLKMVTFSYYALGVTIITLYFTVQYISVGIALFKNYISRTFLKKVIPKTMLQNMRLTRRTNSNSKVKDGFFSFVKNEKLEVILVSIISPVFILPNNSTNSYIFSFEFNIFNIDFFSLISKTPSAYVLISIFLFTFYASSTGNLYKYGIKKNIFFYGIVFIIILSLLSIGFTDHCPLLGIYSEKIGKSSLSLLEIMFKYISSAEYRAIDTTTIDCSGPPHFIFSE